MSEPRILTPTDRARIRDLWLIDDYDTADVAALLDTCDAMQAAATEMVRASEALVCDYREESGIWWDDFRAVLRDLAAVLDTIREDHTDGR